MIFSKTEMRIYITDGRLRQPQPFEKGQMGMAIDSRSDQKPTHEA
jgi:hypothetical protein